MKNNLFKQYWFWVAVIVVVPAALFYLRFDLPQRQASLLVSFENGTIRKFEGPVSPETTVLSALYSASLGGGFEIKYMLQEDGDVMFYGVNQFFNSIDKKNWNFYLNSQSVSTPKINQIPVRNGDTVEVKYE